MAYVYFTYVLLKGGRYSQDKVGSRGLGRIVRITTVHGQQIGRKVLIYKSQANRREVLEMPIVAIGGHSTFHCFSTRVTLRSLR